MEEPCLSTLQSVNQILSRLLGIYLKPLQVGPHKVVYNAVSSRDCPSTLRMRWSLKGQFDAYNFNSPRQFLDEILSEHGILEFWDCASNQIFSNKLRGKCIEEAHLLADVFQ